MTPRATYRFQFQRDFTFDDAARLAPYLGALGISHLYSSPILTARRGSTHGYDGVDPTQVNPELGGEDAFRRLVGALRREGLGIIVDIVPNHLAVGGADNPFWLEALESGESGPYGAFFDIDWHPSDPALRGKVLVPFLGAPYGEILQSGDLKLLFDPDLERIAVGYHQHRYPIRPEDYAAILREGGEGGAALARRFEEAAGNREAFAAARRELASQAERIRPALEAFQSSDRLHDLLERQNYRLAWWRTAGDEINYRRFFEITELAGLRIERPEVFEAVHAVIFRLYAEGLIDGVRVDHVDGLADPGAYCRTLRARLSELERQRPTEAPSGRAYIVVEKILAAGEKLPLDWQTDGTTGYDFMNQVAGVLHHPGGEAPLTRLWTEISGRPAAFEEEEHLARGELLTRSFAGQLDAAAAAFHRLARADLKTRDVTFAALRRALAALLGAFPAYRTYATGERGSETDARMLDRAVTAAKEAAAPGEREVLDLVASWLLKGEGGTTEGRREAAVRFQQLSAPIAAKAVEDTAFYRYGRLLSRNDVGFDPGRFALPLEDFHETCADRNRDVPHALLATATHDHKRGEDVRVRLAALSEVPERWTEGVRRWFDANAPLRQTAIDPADEYQLYQMIVGAWPPELEPDDREGLRTFTERLAGWQEKALREAKLRSSWIESDTAYEEACRRFLEGILDPGRSGDFLASLTAFVQGLGPVGALNGLTQAFLRCTTPGVPDTYQGTEFWDWSLVDPDNRRPVDYPARERALSEALDWGTLLASWHDGRVKQAMIARVLQTRREMPQVFADGDYTPLPARGPRADSIIAFARRHGPSVIVAVATRWAADATWDARPLPGPDWWGDTAIPLPDDMAGLDLDDAFNPGQSMKADHDLPAASLFTALPVSLRIRAG